MRTLPEKMDHLEGEDDLWDTFVNSNFDEPDDKRAYVYWTAFFSMREGED